jgi:hypothetical protein
VDSTSVGGLGISLVNSPMAGGQGVNVLLVPCLTVQFLSMAKCDILFAAV